MMSEEKQNSNIQVTISFILYCGSFLLFLYLLTFGKGLIEYVAIYILFLIIFIIIPFKDLIKKGSKKEKIALFMLLRMIIFSVFTISGYLVFNTRNYNLKYTYWLFILSLFIMVIFSEIQWLPNKLRKFRNKHGQFSRMELIAGSILIYIILNLPFLLSIRDYLPDQKVLAIASFPELEKISLHVYEWNENKLMSQNIIDVKESEVLEAIQYELSNLQVSFYTLTEEWNFVRMRKESEINYVIYFDFVDYSAKRNLFGDASVSLTLLPNRIAALERYGYKKTLILGRSFRDIFQVNLTEETMDMIFSYIK
jgi:hypothetical protein